MIFAKQLLVITTKNCLFKPTSNKIFRFGFESPAKEDFMYWSKKSLMKDYSLFVYNTIQKRFLKKKFFSELRKTNEIIEISNNVLVGAISIIPKSGNTYLKIFLNKLIIKVWKAYLKNVTKINKKKIFWNINWLILD